MEAPLDRNAIAAMIAEYVHKIQGGREVHHASKFVGPGVYGLTPAEEPVAERKFEGEHFFFPNPNRYLRLTNDPAVNTEMLRDQLEDALAAAKDYPDHPIIFWRFLPRLDTLFCESRYYCARIVSRFSILKEVANEDPKPALAAGPGQAPAQAGI